MQAEPQKPIREYRFKLWCRTQTGDITEAEVAPEDEKKVEALLSKLSKFVNVADDKPIYQLRVDVGDRQETWGTGNFRAGEPFINNVAEPQEPIA